ncbi:MAG: ABC transporter permease [Desulfobacterales bacterium]|nr:ABC transporter permease [Desulfobacterales bacterium]
MKKVTTAMTYVLTFLVVIAAWQIASLIIGEMILPGPLPTLSRLLQVIGHAAFWEHMRASVWRIIAGLALAFITAVPLGLMLGSSPRLDRMFTPLIYLSYPVPKIVFLPVVLLLFGLGDTSKIILITLIIFFQLIITTRDSARQVSTAMIYSFRSLGGNRWHFFRHIIWPVSLPGIFTSLRIGIGIAVAVLFFVESIGTRRGMGFYIIDAWGRADYPDMFVGIIALSFIGIILYEVFDMLEKRVCRWNQN